MLSAAINTELRTTKTYWPRSRDCAQDILATSNSGDLAARLLTNKNILESFVFGPRYIGRRASVSGCDMTCFSAIFRQQRGIKTTFDLVKNIGQTIINLRQRYNHKANVN